MALTVEQKTWLGTFASVAQVKEKYDQERGHKDALLQEMRIKLDALKPQIQAGFTMELNLKNSKKKIDTLSETGTQMDELDTEDIMDTKGITDEDRRKSQAAME